MTTFYEFEVGRHNEQAHEYTSLLWHLARRSKESGEPTTADERIARVDELCEEHRRQIDERRPEKNALDRMASLVLFDELTDTHPDKMTREEYPIMSEWQEDARNEKYVKVKELTHGDRLHNGRRKSYYFGEDGEVGVSNKRMPGAEEASINNVVDRLYVSELLENSGLTDRQRQAIDLVFFRDMTQEDAAVEMEVSQQAVGKFLSTSLRKIREYATKI